MIKNKRSRPSCDEINKILKFGSVAVFWIFDICLKSYMRHMLTNFCKIEYPPFRVIPFPMSCKYTQAHIFSHKNQQIPMIEIKAKKL